MQQKQQLKGRDSYTANDCEQLSANVSLKNKVVVVLPVGQERLKQEQFEQEMLAPEAQSKRQALELELKLKQNQNLNLKQIASDPTELPDADCATGQLFFCLDDRADNANAGSNNNVAALTNNGNNDIVQLVSLSTGEQQLYHRKAILGILKPEYLPEDAKLQLSQIRPRSNESENEKGKESKNEDENENEENLEAKKAIYFGYAFLPDGRYAAAVKLYSAQEVTSYIAMQKPYQHGILICDREGFAVIKVIEGKIAFVNV